MLQTKNNVIYLTKGDTCVLDVSLKLASGEDYELQEGDKLILTVRQLAKKTSPVLISSESTTQTIYIRPEDTAEIRAGKYSYDVQLVRPDGDIYTVIGAETTSTKIDNFILLPEVTIP